MRHTLSGRVVFLLFLLCCQSLSAGEEKETTARRLWANFGMGILKSSKSQADLSRLLSLSYQHRIHLVTLRYMTARNFCEIAGCKFFKDVSLLYGLSSRWHKVHLSVSFGPSLTSIQDGSLERDENGSFLVGENGDFLHRKAKTLGMALATQLFWRPSRALGLGVYGLGNLNSERHFLGAMLSIQLVGNF